MSAEEQMNMVEILSEELGEKELKIMALEKELEEQKKQKLEYLELSEILQYKLDWHVERDDDDDFSPQELIEDYAGITNSTYEIMIKTLLYYFGGEIWTREKIIENLVGSDMEESDFEQLVDDEAGWIVELRNGEYWVSDSAVGM
tara:strand:- start:409 stop:843 length:435 start_codon:yes stop_codon:yes gene_type:complete